MTGTTRICVKNIGKNTKEDKLKLLFSKCGEVTDVKIAKKPDGSSRNFAFVGFRSEEQALEAQKYYNHTFIGLSRMTVEMARKLQDGPKGEKPSKKPPAVAKQAEKKQEQPKVSPTKVAEVAKSKTASAEPVLGKKKKQFLDLVLKKPAQAPTAPEDDEDNDNEEDNEAGGSNDGYVEEDAKEDEEEDAMSVASSKSSASSSSTISSASFVDFDDLIPGNNKNKKKIIKQSKDSSAEDDDNHSQSKKKSKEDLKKKDSSKKEDNASKANKPMSDLDYLRSKMKNQKQANEDGEKDEEEEEDEDDDDNSSKSSNSTDNKEKEGDEEEKEMKENEESLDHDNAEQTVDVAASVTTTATATAAIAQYDDNRLYITNLPYTCTEEELRTYFTSSSPPISAVISEVHIPIDNQTRRNKGYGFIRYVPAITEHSEDGEEQQQVSSKAAGTAVDLTPLIKYYHGLAFQGRVIHVTRAIKPTNATTATTSTDPQQQLIQQEEQDAQLLQHLMATKRMTAYQARREVERRRLVATQAHAASATAGSGGSGGIAGWNAAYVRSDAVIDSLAASLGVSQQEILDNRGLQAGQLAVRIAIGEAQILEENAKFFLTYGIDINATNNNSNSSNSTVTNNKTMKRSDKILLIKNLPSLLSPNKKDNNNSNNLIEELESMFAKYGLLTAFVVAPSGTLAIVSYEQPVEARAAYRGLAYRRFKESGPMYLEWAPMLPSSSTTLSSTTAPTSDDNSQQPVIAATKTTQATITSAVSAVSSSSSSSTAIKPIATEEDAAENDDNMQDYSTLFIKNLNFSTSETALQQHILNKGCTGLRAVIIMKKPASAGTSSSSSHMLSQGYGFLEFRTVKAAQQAIALLQGSILDSHTLEVKPSDKRITIAPVSVAASSGSSSAAANTKILVRNLAFQATKKELQELFMAFGSIQRIRLPKTMTAGAMGINGNGGNGGNVAGNGHQHRGFAFVDFTTRQEAINAMQALKNTHLYGRRLVLEWAQQEQSSIEGGDQQQQGMIASADNNRKRMQMEQSALSRRKKGRKDESSSSGLGGGEDDRIGGEYM